MSRVLELVLHLLGCQLILDADVGVDACEMFECRGCVDMDFELGKTAMLLLVLTEEAVDAEAQVRISSASKVVVDESVVLIGGKRITVPTYVVVIR
jgi:hypothetical protein